MKPYEPEQLAVIIVNYYNKILTINCIKSIFNLHTLPKDIIVVDNGSNEYLDIFLEWQKISSMYRRNSPYLCTDEYNFPSSGDALIVIKDNKGFSAGNNTAIKNLLNRKNKYRGFWLINNDTILDSYALKNICKRMNSLPSAHIVGSTLVNASNKKIVQCAAGGSISKITGRTSELLGKTILREYTLPERKKIENSLDYINGASMFISTDVIDNIGLLDEHYFLYYEDSDFCTRAKKLNFYLGWAHDSIVYHSEGASSKKLSSLKTVEYYSTRNRIIFMRKYFNYGKILSLVTLPLFIFSNICKGNFFYIKLLYRIYKNRNL